MACLRVPVIIIKTATAEQSSHLEETSSEEEGRGETDKAAGQKGEMTSNWESEPKDQGAEIFWGLTQLVLECNGISAAILPIVT